MASPQPLPQYFLFKPIFQWRALAGSSQLEVVAWAISALAMSSVTTNMQAQEEPFICYLKIKSSPGLGIKNLKKFWLIVNRAPRIGIPGIGLLSHNVLLSSWLD